QCHASTPHKGRNSLVAAARLILALEGLRADFPASDPLFSPPRSTFEPTKMEANVPNVNTIPGKDVFYLDCRILPNYSTDEVFDACERIARQVEEITETSVTLEKSYRQEAPDPTPPDAPVVRALASAVGRVTGREARPMGIGGGTVAAFFRRAGFPAAVWSTVSDTARSSPVFSWRKRQADLDLCCMRGWDNTHDAIRGSHLRGDPVNRPEGPQIRRVLSGGPPAGSWI
ncbi:MAG: peptidase dimerization domain-containing protein, partial [Deltaproteobacteria bacterium]|nr:peptidase dimerization domain-containing protein [Deltaproteobacteria bacterium]